MDPRDRGRRILAMTFIASLAFTFIFLGLFLIGETIWTVDCERSSGSVNCVITTRSLGFFVSRHTVNNLIRAEQVEDCQEDSCSYHIELLTGSGWQTYFLDSFSNESKAVDVDRINAYLMDSSQQSLHTRVVYWHWFLPFGAGILIGGAGLVFALFLGLNLRRRGNEWQPVILGKKKDGPSPLDRTYAKTGFDPAPAGLRVERDASGICFQYRHPAPKGWIWLLLGAVMIGLGWSREPVYFWMFTLVGLLFFYIGLVTLINQWTIQVAKEKLSVRYHPLPFYHRRRWLPASAILQLYVARRIVYARTGEIEYYVLEAILQDHRCVTLLSELPYDVVHSIELQIEDWLQLDDRWVEGEAFSEKAGTIREWDA